MLLKNFTKLFERKQSPLAGRLSANTVVPEAKDFDEDIREDKRLAPRIDVSVPVAVFVLDSSVKWCKAKIVNYSYSGIRLKVPFIISQGVDVNIDLKLPNVPDPLTLCGSVVWSSIRNTPTGTDIECGLAFKDQHVRRVSQRDKLIFFLSNEITNNTAGKTTSLTTSPVQSEDELVSCFRLLHEAYLKKGYCEAKESKLHYSHYCFFPRSKTFTIKEKDKLKGTVTLIPDSPGGLPLDSVFPHEMAWLRNAGKKIAEVSLLTINPSETGKRKNFTLTQFEKQSILFFLFKIMYEYARRVEGVTDFIIGVHPKHETMYKNMMFTSLAPVKSYGAVNGNPVILLHLNLIRAEQMWPIFLKVFFVGNITSNEIINSGLPMNADMVDKFLLKTNRLWENIPEHAKAYLLKSYPGLNV